MREPFPESALSEKEQSQLTGTWRLDETVMQVAFTSNGVAWLAGIEWEDEDFRIEKFRLHFTKHGGALYVSMPVEADRKESGYLFAEIKQDGNQAFVWGSDVDFFVELVKNGTLKGYVEENKHSKSITLESSSAEILELVSTNRAAFDYKNPLLFQKLD